MKSLRCDQRARMPGSPAVERELRENENPDDDCRPADETLPQGTCTRRNSREAEAEPVVPKKRRLVPPCRFWLEHSVSRRLEGAPGRVIEALLVAVSRQILSPRRSSRRSTGTRAQPRTPAVTESFCRTRSALWTSSSSPGSGRPRNRVLSDGRLSPITLRVASARSDCLTDHSRLGIVSPELVLVDPHLGIETRRLLPDPDDTLAPRRRCPRLVERPCLCRSRSTNPPRQKTRLPRHCGASPSFQRSSRPSDGGVRLYVSRP